jgi:uncharacterized protein (TIGR03435 family)
MIKRSIPSGFLACAVISAGVCRAQAQPQTAAPVFEVAAIRAASLPTPDTLRSGQFRVGSRIDGATLDFNFVSLAELLPYAFRVKSFQIAGPSWIRESRWNIQAKLPDGASQDQAPEMMQALLAERFQLSIHHDKREQPVYELVAGKGPLKLAPSEAGADADSGASASSLPGPVPGLPFPGPPPGPGNGGVNSDGRGGPAGRGGFAVGGGTARIAPGPNCGMHMEFTKLTMPALADTLTPFLDRPVVDSTGLKGTYKLTLDLPMEVMFAMMQNMARNSGMAFGPGGRGPDGPGGRGPNGPQDGGFGGGPGRGPANCPDPGAALANGGVDTSNTAIFQAVQQLGLKLQPRKAPFDTIVVDRLEKTPTEN